jgi:hypothetical protein
MNALQGRKVGDMGFKRVLLDHAVEDKIDQIYYFSHGDMLFLSYKAAAEPAEEPVASTSTQTKQMTAQTLSGQTVVIPAAEPDVHFAPTGVHGDRSGHGTISGGPSEAALTKPLADLTKIKEMTVDKFWRVKDGKIPRKRDEKMCKHGAKGMCDYCMPLEVRRIANTQAYHETKTACICPE